jgi:hypothetical protein
MCHKQLERLSLVHKVPDTVKDIQNVVHATVFGVLEAMLNLIGRELAYFQVRGGKSGLFSLRMI